jgi:hypothetical protein
MTERPLTRRELRELERTQSEDAYDNDGTDDYVSPLTGPINLEPKSLVVAAVPDITNISLVIPETGELLKTGSIELPVLNADTAEVAKVEAATQADKALLTERTESVVLGIEPIPARRHTRSRKRSSVFPTNLRRGWGNVYLVLSTAILSVAVFGVYLVALMLGFIK